MATRPAFRWEVQPIFEQPIFLQTARMQWVNRKLAAMQPAWQSASRFPAGSQEPRWIKSMRGAFQKIKDASVSLWNCILFWIYGNMPRQNDEKWRINFLPSPSKKNRPVFFLGGGLSRFFHEFLRCEKKNFDEAFLKQSELLSWLVASQSAISAKNQIFKKKQIWF